MENNVKFLEVRENRGDQRSGEQAAKQGTRSTALNAERSLVGGIQCDISHSQHIH